MLRVSSLFFTAVLLSACEPAARSGEQFANNLKDNIYNTAYAVEDWANTPPKGQGTPLPMRHTYCYKVQTDVLCYRRPMPGLESTLVGYQGAGAPPPPAITTRLLPKSVLNESMTPEKRISTAKPVFDVAPEEVDPTAPSVEIAPDGSGSEILPDPNTSPQL